MNFQLCGLGVEGYEHLFSNYDQVHPIIHIGPSWNFVGGGSILKKIPSKMTIRKHAIKVNLSRNLADFKSGNGEGVFAIPLTLTEFRWYLKGEEPIYLKGVIRVMLLDNSLNYPSLVWGSVIEVELRGQNRPVMTKEFMRKLR